MKKHIMLIILSGMLAVNAADDNTHSNRSSISASVSATISTNKRSQNDSYLPTIDSENTIVAGGNMRDSIIVSQNYRRPSLSSKEDDECCIIL